MSEQVQHAATALPFCFAGIVLGFEGLSLREDGMRWILLLGLVALPFLPAAAHALELTGNYGYAGEWGVSATLDEVAVGRSQARYYSGPVRLRHLAACGPNEVPQKSGEIHMSRVGRDRYAASLVVDGQQCTVSGALSPNEVAFARCGAEARVPLRLWEKGPGGS